MDTSQELCDTTRIHKVRHTSKIMQMKIQHFSCGPSLRRHQYLRRYRLKRYENPVNKWKRFWMKWPCMTELVSCHLPGKTEKKNTQHHSQDCQRPDQNLNQALSEYNYSKFYSHQLMHFFIQLCISLLSYIKIT